MRFKSNLETHIERLDLRCANILPNTKIDVANDYGKIYMNIRPPMSTMICVIVYCQCKEVGLQKNHSSWYPFFMQNNWWKNQYYAILCIVKQRVNPVNELGAKSIPLRHANIKQWSIESKAFSKSEEKLYLSDPLFWHI